MVSRKWNRYELQAAFAAGIMVGFLLSSFTWLVSVPKSEILCSYQQLATSSARQQSNALSNTFQQYDSGWKLIHVFFGNNSHIAESSNIPSGYFKLNNWFSQYRQDEVVSMLFSGKRNGYFVDLASNDAVRISNTYALETFFDWQGLCLEPNPIYWDSLSYRKCHVAAAVIGKETMGEVKFTFPKEKATKGGIIGDVFDNKIAKETDTQSRYTVTLYDVFKRFSVPKIIDYFSLDVEGAEYYVMESFPFSEYRFNVLTVERPTGNLSNLLRANDYLLLKTLKEKRETLWVHRSFEAFMDKSALEVDTKNYKYRESIAQPRQIPRETA